MAFDLTLADKGRPEILKPSSPKWVHMGFRVGGTVANPILQTRFSLPHGDSELVLSMLGAVEWTAASAAADKAHQPQPEAPIFFRAQRYRPVAAGLPPNPADWTKEGDFWINSTEDEGPIFLRARGPERVVWAHVYRALLTTFLEEEYGIDYKLETSATPGEAAPPVTLTNRIFKGGVTA